MIQVKSGSQTTTRPWLTTVISSVEPSFLSQTNMGTFIGPRSLTSSVNTKSAQPVDPSTSDFVSVSMTMNTKTSWHTTKYWRGSKRTKRTRLSGSSNELSDIKVLFVRITLHTWDLNTM